MSPAAPEPETRVGRHPERQVQDRAALHRVLDAATVAHLAVSRPDGPVVLPLLCARDGDRLLLHGSTGAGVLTRAAAGEPVAVAVTVLDGLVFAASMFGASANYRSAVIFGSCRSLTGAQKVAALRALSDRLMPGRWQEVPEPTAKELAGTLVLELPLDRTSVKVREGGPGDEPVPGCWRGILPVTSAVGSPQPETGSEHLAVPASVRATAARLTGDEAPIL